jgi:hypothetical protein
MRRRPLRHLLLLPNLKYFHVSARIAGMQKYTNFFHYAHLGRDPKQIHDPDQDSKFLIFLSRI